MCSPFRFPLTVPPKRMAQPSYATERLAIHLRTNLDLIKEDIPKPRGYLPPRSLPTWELLPIENKLPLVPAPGGALYFTRGKLGESLVRKSNGPFITVDPLNQERVPSNKYEPLHDPFQHYEKRKYAMKTLKKEKLVNGNNEATCSLKEFNRYRKYLATGYNDKVRERIAEMDRFKNAEIQQRRAMIQSQIIEKASTQTQLNKQREEYRKEYVQRQEEARRKRYEQRQLRDEANMELFKTKQLRQQILIAHMNEERMNKRNLRIMGKEEEYQRKLRDIANQNIVKQANSIEQRKRLENERKLIAEMERQRWFDAKLASSSRRLEREIEMQSDFDNQLKQRAARRQKYVEKFRAELPMRNARRQKERERIEALVRRCAMRWLNRTRQRLNQPTDEEHRSVWYTDKKNLLRHCVDDLHEASGYEKMETVVTKFQEALKLKLLGDLEESDEFSEYYD